MVKEFFMAVFSNCIEEIFAIMKFIRICFYILNLIIKKHSVKTYLLSKLIAEESF
jgi:hypothetical protein